MCPVLRSFKAQETEAGLDFDVEFDPERSFHCLVGVNGVGKTHLIEHIARSLIFTHSMFDEGGSQRFSRLFLRAEINQAIKSLKMLLPRQIDRDDETIKSRQNSNWNAVKLEQIAKHARSHLTTRPVVFVGARERGHTRNVERDRVHLLGNREDRFIASFKKTWNAATGQVISAEEPAEWFVSRMLINPSFVQGNDNDYIAVGNTLQLLQRLDPIAFADVVKQDPETGKLQVQLGYINGSLMFAGRPIDKLATGYIAILKIFQEILAGYSGWAAMEASSPKQLLDLDGIVFIDEIEAHLHPQWQARIVGVLKQGFPNTTFFVTTHSPLVVRQTEPGEAIEILRDGNKVTSRRLGSPRDWYLADLYAEAFHVDVPVPGQDAPDGARPLSDVMLDFSNAVREHTKRKT